MNLRHTAILILTLLLAAGAFACGGGGGDPVDDPINLGSNNGSGATLTGKVLDREGTPQGAPYTSVKLSLIDGSQVSPAQQPNATGTDAGMFKFLGLPIGVPLVLEIDLFQISIGRNLGYIQQVTLTSGGTFDLGDIVLENDFLDNGWSAYITKDYSLAIMNFQRAFEDRFIQADLSYSSSAYTGLGWVYAKRGKDNHTGISCFVSGIWADSMNSYEWDQALLNFDRAIANPNDSDAYVGMAGTYLTLLGQSNKNPVLIGPWIPFYGFISWYFEDAQEALDRVLLIDPDYNCHHDDITANDLRVTNLFLQWAQGEEVSLEQVSNMAALSDINQGSKQLLSVLPDLITYNPYPQL